MGVGTATQDEPRAGVRVLELLANPLHVRILRSLEDGPLRLTELHERAEWPAQTTLRAAIATLREYGLLRRREVSRMPFGVANELSEAGREALFVAAVTERWLAKGPQGPIPVDSNGAKAAIKALAAGWSSTLVRELAHRPVSLTELNRLIPAMSYPSLERRLVSMRTTRQVEPAPTSDRGQPFEVTEWLRHSVAPLAAAGRCERRYLREDSAPITAVEIEASFLLAIPLVSLPASAHGVCVLSVPTEGGEDDGDDRNLAGVTVEVRAGAIFRCVPEVARDVRTWALGSAGTWLNAVIDGEFADLRFGGSRPQVAADLVQGLHLGLFGDGSR